MESPFPTIFPVIPARISTESQELQYLWQGDFIIEYFTCIYLVLSPEVGDTL